MTSPWRYKQPFIVSCVVEVDDIDALDHANNTSYLKWLERAAWGHSLALGIDMAEFRRLDRAMVARQHQLDYLAAAFLGDILLVGTWITENTEKLTMRREYQIVRQSDQRVLLQAHTLWACIQLSSGKPKRMPPEFIERYRVST